MYVADDVGTKKYAATNFFEVQNGWWKVCMFSNNRISENSE